MIVGLLLSYPGARAATPGTMKWSFKTGAGITSSPALGVDGTVYFGSGDSNVYALDGQTGLARWKFATAGVVSSSPAVGNDGTVYVGSRDGKVYAIDGQTGRQRWAYNAFLPVDSSPAISSDGTVYVGVWQKMYALDGQTGNEVWEFYAGGIIHSSPALDNVGYLYFGSDDGKIYTLNQSTGLKFSEFSVGGRVRTSPAYWNAFVELLGPVVFTADGSGSLYGLYAGGGVRWSFAAGAKVTSSPVYGRSWFVYAGCSNGKLFAVDAAGGSKRWEFTAGAAVSSTPALGIDDRLYVGSDDGNLYALDALTGAKLWAFTTGGAVSSSPVIAADGTVYFGSADRYLYAVQSTSAGLAPTGWPAFLQNAQHSGGYKPSERQKLAAASFGGQQFTIAALGQDGTIYSLAGGLTARDPKTGSVKWGPILSNVVEISVSVGSDGVVYSGDSTGHVYAIAGQTGTMLWSAPVGFGSVHLGITPDGTILAGTGSGLYAMDPKSGATKWVTATNLAFGDQVVSTTAVVYSDSTSGSRVTHAFDAVSGSEKWSFAPSNTFFKASAIGDDGTI